MAKREVSPIDGRLVVAIDEATGERFIAWRAMPGRDAQEMASRGYRPGQRVSVEISSKRNIGNFRQAHALAEFVRDNTEAFSDSMDNHAVLKQLQRGAGVECDHETMTIDLGALGVHDIQVVTPRSLSFSTMPQERWRKVFDALKKHVVETYFPTWGEDQVRDFEDILRGNLPP